MQTRRLGTLYPVSRLALGGGGLGQIWGKTDREEAIATVHAAVAGGITLFDSAPLYGRGEAETVLGLAFAGRPPPGARFTTKCGLGNPPANEVASIVRRRLERSLEAMRLAQADLLFLHSYVVPDDYRVPGVDAETQDRFATRLSLYRDRVVPVFEDLAREGLIRHWGVTGIGLPAAIVDVLGEAPRPAVVQCIANCLDSAGGLNRFAVPAQPREIIAAARANGVGVMGIRAVQAGALTDALDRELAADNPDRVDFDRAAGLRALARTMGTATAKLAHRYALGIDGVDTVVLGVKNREELKECLDAEEEGPLTAEQSRAVDAAVGRR